MADVVRRRAPICTFVVGVREQRHRIARRRGIEGIPIVHRFGPGIHAAERQPSVEATVQIQLQRIVGTRALGDPRPRIGERGVRLAACGIEIRPRRHRLPGQRAIHRHTADRVQCRGERRGARRRWTDHRNGRIGVHADDLVIAVAADIAHTERCVRQDFPFDPERVRDQSRGIHVGLHAARQQKRKRSGRRRCAGLNRIACRGENVGEAGGGNRIDRVRGRILVRAITQRILQVVVHPEPRMDHRLLIEGAPRDTDSRLRQEFRAVDREQRVSHVRQTHVRRRL